jgi:hypothetical protein
VTQAATPCSSRALSRSLSLSAFWSCSVAAAQVDRSADGLDGVDVFDDGVLAHLGAAERVVAEDHDVGLAGLESAPLLGALLGGVGLGGDEALALAAADPLALAADDEDAVVGEHAQKSRRATSRPASSARARRGGGPSPLARAGDDADGGVGLADADVEGDEAAGADAGPAHWGPSGRCRGARVNRWGRRGRGSCGCMRR